MIQVEDLTVKAGHFVLRNISFEIPSGHYGVLMGKTGSGKTTLLEAICGLKEVISGSIVLHGRDVTRSSAGDRGIGFVPQEATLFSTMSVRGHLAFGPKTRRWARAEIENRVEELARRLSITHLLDRKPRGLSGGERQRVALGRALSIRPGVLCLDEPLSALDEETHRDMLQLLAEVVKENHITVLHITHSRTEAGKIADRLLRLENGKVTIENETK